MLVYRLRTGPSLYADKSNEKITQGTWPESVAAAQQRFGVDPDTWVPVLGNRSYGTWIPAAAAARSKASKLVWSTGGKINFGEPGRPCTALVSGDMSSRACGRPAVVSEGGARGFGIEDGVAHRCKMHEAGVQRQRANDAARHEKWEAESVERERLRANKARCEEVLEQIRPLLAELGVHPATLAVGSAPGGKVGILLPAETAELLTSKAIELEEIIGS